MGIYRITALEQSRIIKFKEEYLDHQLGTCGRKFSSISYSKELFSTNYKV